MKCARNYCYFNMECSIWMDLLLDFFLRCHMTSDFVTKQGYEIFLNLYNYSLENYFFIIMFLNLCNLNISKPSSTCTKHFYTNKCNNF